MYMCSMNNVYFKTKSFNLILIYFWEEIILLMKSYREIWSAKENIELDLEEYNHLSEIEDTGVVRS